MKVVLSNSTDIFAGGEDYVLILARHLARRGHLVWVSANPGHLLLRKCADAGIDTLPLLYSGMSRVFAVAAQLRSRLRSLSIDVVHSNANYDRTVAGIATAWSQTRHVASVHSSHSIQHNITHWLRNRFGTDHFIADADSVRSVLVTEDGIAAKRISIIPIGVEESRPDSVLEWRRRTRAAWGVSTDTIIIGNVARLVPFKGHHYLLEAIARCVNDHANVLCVIVGDGELMADLREQARTLQIAQFVRFMGFQDNLHELYPAFDIYCHASLDLEAEAFPLAILRALATGLPVVATRVGGIALMVQEGASGYLTRPQDGAAMAAALRSVIGDPHLRNSMGIASLELFRKSFDASTMAERVEEVYLDVIKRRQPQLSFIERTG